MNSKKFIFAAALLVILSLIPVYFAFGAGSAAINISAVANSYKVGQTFKMQISIDPASVNIDTVRAKLTFPPDLLEIKSFSTNPIFSYQAGANGFDNTAGTFSWGAGIPGGISVASNFGTVVFGVKKSGNAQISVSKDSLVLSAGINVFNGQLSSASFNLLADAALSSGTSHVKKTNPEVQHPAPVVEQPISANTAVETQILPKTQPQDFAASVSGPFSFLSPARVLAFLGVILLIFLMGFTLYKIIAKPILNDKQK